MGRIINFVDTIAMILSLIFNTFLSLRNVMLELVVRDNKY